MSRCTCTHVYGKTETQFLMDRISSQACHAESDSSLQRPCQCPPSCVRRELRQIKTRSRRSDGVYEINVYRLYIYVYLCVYICIFLYSQDIFVYAENDWKMRDLFLVSIAIGIDSNLYLQIASFFLSLIKIEE